MTGKSRARISIKTFNRYRRERTLTGKHYRDAYHQISKLHQFKFQPSKSIKEPFTKYQKATISKMVKKYGWMIDKLAEKEMIIYKPKTRKIFRDLAKSNLHSNKGFIFVRERPDAKIKPEYNENNQQYEFHVAAPIRTFGKVKRKIYSVTISIPNFIMENYLMFPDWLRALRDKYPKGALFSLIFGHTGYAVTPVEIDKMEYYATGEISKHEMRIQEHGKAKFPYSGVKVSWAAK